MNKKHIVTKKYLETKLDLIKHLGIWKGKYNKQKAGHLIHTWESFHMGGTIILCCRL